MLRNQLRTPFSTFIRKNLPQSISLNSLEETTTELQNQPHFSTPCSFNTNPQTRISTNSQIHLIWSSKFLGKSSGFCSSASSTRCCWNCKSQGPFLICQSCGSIQPVDHSVDYFRIFGLDRKFDIEVGSLEGKYKEWQKKLHPDLVHTKSEEEREYAAEQSARVIDAYTTLRKPLSRAIYIIRLEGVEVDEEQTVSEPELLGEIMEIREAVEEATDSQALNQIQSRIMEIREAVEEATDSQALNQIQSRMDEKLSHWCDSFGNAFRSKEYDDAIKSIQRMTYYQRVKEEIVKKL